RDAIRKRTRNLRAALRFARVPQERPSCNRFSRRCRDSCPHRTLAELASVRSTHRRRMESSRPRNESMIGLRYFSFWGPIGYAQAARRYLLGLKRLGFPVTWTPILGNPERADYVPFEGTSVGDPDLDPLCNRDIEYDVALLHTTPFYYPRL